MGQIYRITPGTIVSKQKKELLNNAHNLAMRTIYFVDNKITKEVLIKFIYNLIFYLILCLKLIQIYCS
jgi:hypothetical protein